jgi:DNA-binding NtrC family response regulator
MARVLIVDDEPSQRDVMRIILTAENHVLEEAESVDGALRSIELNQPQVVLTDMKMPKKTGVDLVEAVARMEFGPEIVVITAYGTIETAVKAMRLGAYDYLTKPIEREELILIVKRAAEKYSLRANTRQWRDESLKHACTDIVAESAAMKEVLETARKVADSDATVLLRGDSGTGKERIAWFIHSLSRRSVKPMHCINCAAFPESLLESELLGHEKGSFTGAHARKIGILEAAGGGTLLLDEVADMSPPTQAKILRSIQEKEVRRLGGTSTIPIDARFIAATNRNLEDAVANGSFREDLFYRLNIVPIVLPPLRERPADIKPLVELVLARRGRQKSIDDEAMRALSGYQWPGNVRELEAVIERMAILSPGTEITIHDLPADIVKPKQAGPNAVFSLPDAGIQFEEWERSLLEQALNRSRGVMTEAAKLLGMTYRTFQYRAEKFGLTKTE